MTAAMLSIPLVDGLAKYLSADYSPLFISWARYAVASAVVLPFAAARHGASLLPAERIPAHTLRTVCLVVSMSLYFLAIARIPLASAVSAFFVGPIAAMVLSSVILGERLNLRKVSSVVLGFVGSLVILRPRDGIEPGLLLAFGSGLFFALYMIATRQASQGSDPVKTLAFQCVVGTLLLAPQAVLYGSAPAPTDWLFFLGLGVFSAISHILSIFAFKLAEASTLAPLVYIELIGTSIVGYLAFGEIPGPATLTGALLITAGGLLLVLRNRLS
jgi:drug/metabolite transporter (DMT)-like permease